MKAYLVDDERLCLDELAWQLSHYPDIQIAGSFTHSLQAVKAIENDRPDAVFLDIDMPRLDGLELAQKIQARHPGVIIIFVTAYAQYALEAYKSYPLDFLVKPVPDERLEKTVAHLRRQYRLLHPEGQKPRGLKIRCFGPFEVQSDSGAKFSTRRVKELLLYLIGRHGVAATRGEMLDALFNGRDDRNTMNNLYITLSRLKTLLDCWDGARSSIRLTEGNALMIAPGVCDYTDFMNFAAQNAVLSPGNAAEAARALALWRGPYLEKEAFDWSTETALEAEAEYERVALGLAACHIAADRVQNAESVLRTLLVRNPLSEDGYGALLDLYMQTSAKEAYAALYMGYARMLKQELRIKPSAKYQKHYRTLKGV